LLLHDELYMLIVNQYWLYSIIL